MLVLFCHGLGSSIRNRISTQLTQLLTNTKHTFEAIKFPTCGVWRVTEWQKAVEKRLIIADEKVLVVGQSAGCNPLLNAVMKQKEKIAGMFLVSPGFDVDWSYIDKVIPGAFNKLRSGERVIHPASRNGEEIPVDFESFRMFRETCVSKLSPAIPITCPVRIVHGDADPLVPVENSRRLLAELTSKEKKLTIVSGGSHFLSIEGIVRDEFIEFINRLTGENSDSSERKKAKL